MPVDIRPFEAADEDAVVALWAACGLVRPWNDPRRDIARKLSVQPDLFLVAAEGDVIVGAGMAGFDGHRGWVNYLAVATDRREVGIGQALMAAFEERLLALGCPKVNLQVRAGNHDVLAFYGRLGYVEDAVVSLGKRLIPDS
jgi:ribosomal protein S18 acetylase RimI-like enzyme